MPPQATLLKKRGACLSRLHSTTPDNISKLLMVVCSSVGLVALLCNANAVAAAGECLSLLTLTLLCSCWSRPSSILSPPCRCCFWSRQSSCPIRPTSIRRNGRSVRPCRVQSVAAADAMSLETSSCFQVALKFGILNQNTYSQFKGNIFHYFSVK